MNRYHIVQMGKLNTENLSDFPRTHGKLPVAPGPHFLLPNLQLALLFQCGII